MDYKSLPVEDISDLRFEEDGLIRKDPKHSDPSNTGAKKHPDPFKEDASEHHDPSKADETLLQELTGMSTVYKYTMQEKLLLQQLPATQVYRPSFVLSLLFCTINILFIILKNFSSQRSYGKMGTALDTFDNKLQHWDFFFLNRVQHWDPLIRTWISLFGSGYSIGTSLFGSGYSIGTCVYSIGIC